MTASTTTNGPVSVPLRKFPATLPLNLSMAGADTVALKVIGRFNDALAKQDSRSVAALFFKDGCWPDHLWLEWGLYIAKGMTESPTSSTVTDCVLSTQRSSDRQISADQEPLH
ncbi:hypothetical protein BDW71DRAFT_209350 [Aspergillus fruticulosus]